MQTFSAHATQISSNFNVLIIFEQIPNISKVYHDYHYVVQLEVNESC